MDAARFGSAEKRIFLSKRRLCGNPNVHADISPFKNSEFFPTFSKILTFAAYEKNVRVAGNFQPSFFGWRLQK
jgi:hypothetical protein